MSLKMNGNVFVTYFPLTNYFNYDTNFMFSEIENYREEMIMTKTWTSELVSENFTAVYDLARDVRDALQISEEINIPLFKSLIGFPQLQSNDSIHLRDKYCEFRLNAAKLLIKHNLINNFDLNEGSHRWEGHLKIIVNDKNDFNKFVEILDAEYLQRKNLEEAGEINSKG